MPKISVVIPTINEEKLIGMCLKSISKQTFKDFEVLVVDGGSKDKTVSIAKRYARVIIERRRGTAIARNRGASAAKGEIITFVDADTALAPNCLREVYKTLGGRGSPFCTAAWEIKPLETGLSMAIGFWIVTVLYVRLGVLFGRPKIMGTAFAVKKNAFVRAGKFDEKLMTYEDWDFANKISRVGPVAFIKNTYAISSARRVARWGFRGFFQFHVSNMFKHRFSKPYTEYEQVR